MAKTREQIQFKVLAMLTGGDVGTEPSDDDADNIDGYIDSVVAELASDTIYIADPDQLEESLFVTFCKLVADAAAEEYGGKSNPQIAAALRNRMRKLKGATPGYGPQDTVDF